MRASGRSRRGAPTTATQNERELEARHVSMTGTSFSLLRPTVGVFSKSRARPAARGDRGLASAARTTRPHGRAPVLATVEAGRFQKGESAISPPIGRRADEDA
jgi:hypothetical protein